MTAAPSALSRQALLFLLAGLAQLVLDTAIYVALTAAADPSLPKEWPLGLTVQDWTTYDKEALIACKGPGE